MSELDRSKHFIPSAKPHSIKSFKSMMTGGSTGPIEMRPSLRRCVSILVAHILEAIDEAPVRTRTDAHGIFERDEDEISPISGSRSPGQDVFGSAAATRRWVHLNIGGIIQLKMLVRRRSLGDLRVLRESDYMPVERMHTDVELCGQYLELRDKEVKMRHAITIAEASYTLPNSAGLV
jgi:hypothetical protein